jgi:hypothetical protein
MVSKKQSTGVYIIMIISPTLAFCIVMQSPAIRIEFHNKTEPKQHILRAVNIAAKVMADRRNGNAQEIIDKLNNWPLTIHVVKTQYGNPGSCAGEGDPKRRCYGFVCDIPPYGWCVGYFSPYLKGIFYTKEVSCIADSALAHELVHAMEYILTGYTDPNHDDPGLFPDGCVPIENINTRRKCYAESAERKIQLKMRKLFCH